MINKNNKNEKYFTVIGLDGKNNQVELSASLSETIYLTINSKRGKLAITVMNNGINDLVSIHQIEDGTSGKHKLLHLTEY